MLSTLPLGEPYHDCTPITAVLSEISTASRPRVVQAADGFQYIGKPNEVRGDGRVFPTVAQELVCAKLARVAGVPIPEFVLLCYEDGIWFGSRRYEHVIQPFSVEILSRVANPEAIYLISVFDVWIHNSDRHHENLLGAWVGSDFRLTAIDHSHSPLSPHECVDDLANGGTRDPWDCVHACYRQALTDRSALAQAVDQISSVADESIFEAFEGYPTSMWNQEEVRVIQRFLCDRRENLTGLVNRAGGVIPALQEERL